MKEMQGFFLVFVLFCLFVLNLILPTVFISFHEKHVLCGYLQGMQGAFLGSSEPRVLKHRSDKRHKCGDLGWYVVSYQPKRAACVYIHHIQRHLSQQKPENPSRQRIHYQRIHYLINANRSPGR